MGPYIRGTATVLALSFSASAWAQTPDEETLLRECYALRQQGNHRTSLERCQQAVTLHRTPRSVAQLAITEFALERWSLAATHLAEALADQTHPWIQQNRALLEATLARARPYVAEVRVESNERDAALTVNGETRGTLPLSGPLYLLPGRAQIEVRTQGGQTIRRDLTLVAGQSTRESVQFVGSTAVSNADPRHAPTQPAAATDSGATRRVLAWTAGGIALVGFGLGIAGWRLREDAVGGYVAAMCPETTESASERDRCAGLHQRAESDLSQWQAVSIAGLVAGGVFAAGAAVLFATLPSARSGERTRLRCGGGPGDVGIGCEVRF